MTPERLAEIRDHSDRGALRHIHIERRELLAEVDRLRAQVAAVESVLEEGDHGLYCGSHYGGGHCNCWHAKVAKITGYGYE